MRALIAEDDVVSRKILLKVLSGYGRCDIAGNGREAVTACRLAFEHARPYHLICMDIMMPELNGQEALRQIRRLEKGLGLADADAAKVIMTTALSDSTQVVEALYKGGASAYFVKPIQIDEFVSELKTLGLIAP